MAKAGLPKKYAAMGFARGWRAYKAAKRAAGTVRKRGRRIVRRARAAVRRQTTAPVVVIRGGVNPNPKRRRSTVARKRKTRRAAIRRRIGSPVIFRTLTDGAVVGGSAIGGALVMNQVPFLKAQNPWVKGGVLFGAGLILNMMSRNRWAKKIGAGIATGGGIVVLLPFLAPGGGVFSGRRLTDSEVRNLATLGVPRNDVSGRLGIPRSDVSGRRVPTMGWTGRTPAHSWNAGW